MSADWRVSRWLAVVELGLVAAIFAADVRHMIFFSKTPLLFALGWTSLLVRRVGWRGVGLARPARWGPTLLAGVVAGAGMELLQDFVSQPLLTRLMGHAPDLSDFLPLVGNPGLLLAALVLAWVLAAFGEEMVHRGYVLNRLIDLGPPTRAWSIACLVAGSVVFGCGHLDQGATGMVQESLSGLLLGALYFACGRNLAAPIVAHGVVDTLDLVLIYFGKFPNL